MIGTGTALAIAGGLSAVGGITSYFGAKKAGEAQQNMSMAQLAAMIEQRNLAMSAAAPTANELALQESQLNYLADYYDQSQQNLDRSFALADAIDPTITEAAKQTYSLIRGQDSAALDPYKAQVERDRTRLTNQLRDQMGGGFAGTSAGQNALRQFDIRSNEALQIQRDQKLGQLLGIASGGMDMFANVGAQTNNAASTFGALSGNTLSGLQNTQNRMVNAINATNIAPYAGAQFVGDAASGAALSGLGSALGRLGGMGLGAWFNSEKGPFG